MRRTDSDTSTILGGRKLKYKEKVSTLNFVERPTRFLKPRRSPCRFTQVFKVDTGKVPAELKAVRCLESVHEAQLLNYLKANTHIEVELLMNFGNERFVYETAKSNLFNPC